MESIAGGWLGTYAYGGRDTRPPVRFEATFIQNDDRFAGRILDDGDLGEARVVDGVQAGAEVSFVKVYGRRSAATAPVDYQGILSEDGKTLTGTWSLSVGGRKVRGVWDAHRLWWDRGDTLEREAESQALTAVGAR